MWALRAVRFRDGFVDQQAARGRVDPHNAPLVHCDVVLSGAGILLGAGWAYAVLGWGGYWGWDPVENASLCRG
jgi:cytochrome c biogenesis factor